MWVIQNDWALQISKCASIMLDGVDIRIFWDAEKDPDILSFEDESTANAAFDKIIHGIEAGNVIVRV